MTAFFLNHFSLRVQIAVAVSIVFHIVLMSQFTARRFNRPSQNMVLTDVEYLSIAQPVSEPRKTKPRPKPKEIVDQDKTRENTEAVVKPDEPEEEPDPEPAGLAYNPYESQSGLFLPFYAVEEVPLFQNRIMPQYPEHAQKLGQTCKVVLEAYIDTEGIVRMIRIVKSGGEAFDQAAVEALKKSVFKPARINGKPVPVKILVPYVFSLEG